MTSTQVEPQAVRCSASFTRVLNVRYISPFGEEASAVGFRPDVEVIRKLPASFREAVRASARSDSKVSDRKGGLKMRKRNALAAMAVVAMVSLPVGNAGAFDETKYPNWKGQWMRADTGAPRYDP